MQFIFAKTNFMVVFQVCYVALFVLYSAKYLDCTQISYLN